MFPNFVGGSSCRREGVGLGSRCPPRDFLALTRSHIARRIVSGQLVRLGLHCTYPVPRFSGVLNPRLAADVGDLKSCCATLLDPKSPPTGVTERPSAIGQYMPPLAYVSSVQP